MTSTTETAKAKINLTLHVLGRREDGYHALNSVVAFCDVADQLEMRVAQNNQLEIIGPFADGLSPGEDNIIWKAWHHLAAIMPVPNIHVRLTKNLPIASGIGGGTADAAALLRGVLKLANAKLSNVQIKALAKIGADVPVCYHSKACMMAGIGEEVSKLRGLEIPPAIVLVNPLMPCSTAEVFAAMGLNPGQTLQQPDNYWRNDMTKAALQVQPAIAEVLEALSQTRLQNTMMSGSGATCFGLAQSLSEAQDAAKNLKSKYPHWWVQAGRLS